MGASPAIINFMCIKYLFIKLLHITHMLVL